MDIKPLIPYYSMLVGLFGLLSLFFFHKIGFDKTLIVSLPIILSGLYVIPILPTGNRLRDYNFIKIFIIAITWVWFSIWYVDFPSPFIASFAILESFLFMIAVTIPFDIRDIQIDNDDGVKTLATQFGVKKSKIISISLMILSFVFMSLLVLQTDCSLETIYVQLLLYSALAILVSNDYSYKADITLTGFVDGALLAKGLISFFLLCNI